MLKLYTHKVVAASGARVFTGPRDACLSYKATADFGFGWQVLPLGPNDTGCFAQLVDDAIVAARGDAQPFQPSRAQYEAALEPLVHKLLELDPDDANAYVRGSFRGAGTFDAMAVQMLKDKRADRALQVRPASILWR